MDTAYLPGFFSIGGDFHRGYAQLNGGASPMYFEVIRRIVSAMGIPALNVIDWSNPANMALLKQAYERLIQNYQRATISQVFKNMNLSGNLDSGSVKAARYTNSVSQAYGTARAAQVGVALRERPVTVAIKERREIVEEFEEFDSRTAPDYLREVISGRNQDHAMTIARDTEYDFFQTARDEGTQLTTGPAVTGATPQDRLEGLILQLTTLKNDFFSGIDRNMIYVVMNDLTYSALRSQLNIGFQNANVNSAAENFNVINGVTVFPTSYLPTDVNVMAMARGAVAMPTLILPYSTGEIQLSYARSLMTAFALTATAVMPDTIFWA